MEDQPNNQDPSNNDATSTETETPQADSLTSDEKNMAMLAHLLALFTGFLGPLIIWLLKKDESAFIDDQGKESLNFQITSFIIFLGLSILSIIPLVGCITALALLAYIVVWFVFVIIATLKAKEGEAHRYPICIRLLQ